jgi:dTDP-4-amino-4,6-dideoxy-D-galactose acyltransferase
MQMDLTSEPCQFLEWDTQFFGHRIGRVQAHRLEAGLPDAIETWRRNHTIECLYFLADSDDPQTIILAQEYGFQLVEVRMIFERRLKDWDPQTRPREAAEVLIRPAQPQDIPSLQEIAKNSYIDSRFRFDKHFYEAKWQDYYRTWTANSCSGGADLALVAEKGGEVLGYITGQVDHEKSEGNCELIGVKESARHLGVGQELYRSGMDRYVGAGIQVMWVCTQGRNVPMQRMVQRNGFITRSCQLYYHKWFEANREAS